MRLGGAAILTYRVKLPLAWLNLGCSAREIFPNFIFFFFLAVVPKN